MFNKEIEIKYFKYYYYYKCLILIKIKQLLTINIHFKWMQICKYKLI